MEKKRKIFRPVLVVLAVCLLALLLAFGRPIPLRTVLPEKDGGFTAAYQRVTLSVPAVGQTETGAVQDNASFDAGSKEYAAMAEVFGQYTYHRTLHTILSQFTSGYSLGRGDTGLLTVSGSSAEGESYYFVLTADGTIAINGTLYAIRKGDTKALFYKLVDVFALNTEAGQ